MSVTLTHPEVVRPAEKRRRFPRHRLLRALSIVITFTAGLLATLWAIDNYLGRKIARQHGAMIIGPDIYDVVVERVHQPDSRVTTIYLGDSVGRQLFHAGDETNPHQRYLTTNAAISIAGQYYLLRDALESFPNTRQVRLFYTPLSWGNNLDRVTTHDYFCGFFHKFDEVCEILKVKGDLELSAAHAGRWLLPNLMAANSMSNLRLQSANLEWPESDGPNTALWAGMGGEPVLRAGSNLTHLLSPLPQPAPTPPGGITMPVVSSYFLAQMRQLCQQHAITLRILPCPCVVTRPFINGQPYDAPIWFLPAATFRDDIHVKPAALDTIRQQYVARYQLEHD